MIDTNTADGSHVECCLHGRDRFALFCTSF